MKENNDTYILLVMSETIIKRKKPSKLLPHSTFVQVKINSTAQLEALFRYYPEIYRVHIGQYIEETMPFEKEEPIHGVLKRKIENMPDDYGDIVFVHKFKISYGLLGKANFESNHKTRLQFIDIESARAFKEIDIDFTKNGEYPDAEKFNTTVQLKWREAKLRKKYVLSSSNLDQYLLKSPHKALEYLGLNAENDILVTKSSGNLLKGHDDRWHIYLMLDKKMSNKEFQQTFLPALLKKRDPLSQFYILNTLGDKIPQPRWLLVDINKLATPGIFEMCGLNNVALGFGTNHRKSVNRDAWYAQEVSFDEEYQLRINARKEEVVNAFSEDDIKRIKEHRAAVLDRFRKKVTQWVIGKFNKQNITDLSRDQLDQLHKYIKKVYGLHSVEMLAYNSVLRTAQVNRTENKLDKKFSEWGGKEYQEFIRSNNIAVFSLNGHKICDDIKELPAIGYRGNIRNPFDFVDGGWNEGQVWSDGRGVLYNFGGSANWEKIVIPLYEKPKFLSESAVVSENNPVSYSAKNDDSKLAQIVIKEDKRGYINNDDMEALYNECGDALCVLDVPTGKGKTFSVMKTFRPVAKKRAVIFLVPTNTLAIDIFQSYHLYANVYLSKDKLMEIRHDLHEGNVDGDEAKKLRKLLRDQNRRGFDFSKVVVMTYDKFKGELQGRVINKLKKDISRLNKEDKELAKVKMSQLSSFQTELFEDEFYAVMKSMTRCDSWQFVFDEVHKIIELKGMSGSFDATREIGRTYSDLRKNTFFNDICKLACKKSNSLGVLAMSATIHLDDILNIAIDDNLVNKYMIDHKFNDKRYVHFVYSINDSVEAGRVGAADKGLFMFLNDKVKLEDIANNREEKGRMPVLIHKDLNEYKNLCDDLRKDPALDVFITTAAQEGVSISANDNIQYGLINLINGGSFGQSPRDIVQLSNRVRSGNVYMDVLCSSNAFNLGLEWLDMKSDNVFELLESEKTWKDVYFEFLEGVAEWREGLISRYGGKVQSLSEYDEGVIRLSDSAIDYILTIKEYLPELINSEVDKFVVVMRSVSMSGNYESYDKGGVMKVIDTAINAWVLSVRDRYASNSMELMQYEMSKYGVNVSIDIVDDVVLAIKSIAYNDNAMLYYRELASRFLTDWESSSGADIRQKSVKYKLYDEIWRRLVILGADVKFIKQVQSMLGGISKSSRVSVGLYSAVDIKSIKQDLIKDIDYLNSTKYMDKCNYFYGMLAEDILEILLNDGLGSLNTDLINKISKCRESATCNKRLEQTIDYFKELVHLCNIHRKSVKGLIKAIETLRSINVKEIDPRTIISGGLLGKYSYIPKGIHDKFGSALALGSDNVDGREVYLEYTETTIVKELLFSSSGKVSKTNDFSEIFRYAWINRKGVGYINIAKLVCIAAGWQYRDYSEYVNNLVYGYKGEEYDELLICDRYSIVEDDKGLKYDKCHDIPNGYIELSKEDVNRLFEAYKVAVLGENADARNIERNMKKKNAYVASVKDIKNNGALKKLNVVKRFGVKTVQKVESLKSILNITYSRGGDKILFRGSLEEKLIKEEVAQLRVF